MTAHITLEDFSDHFPRLVLSARELPRKPVPFNILLISVVSGLDPKRECSEAELNDILQQWILDFGSGFGVDHANIRRFLIDEGYLDRNPSGSVYTVNRVSRRFSFDPSILAVDLNGLVEDEMTRREERRRRFSAESKT